MKNSPSSNEGNSSDSGSGDGHWLGQMRRVGSGSGTRTIDTRVVGVTYEGRQKILAKVEEGDSLILRREPDNPADSDAIRVERTNGEHIDYINRGLAAAVATVLDQMGGETNATVIEKLGGVPAFETIGARISFTIPEGP